MEISLFYVPCSSSEEASGLIKKMLDDKQITTYQLSKLTGISEQSFSKLRNGLSKELSFSSMVKIADALDISLDEFR